MAEFKLTHLHALALLEFAESQGLSEVYQQVWLLVLSKKVKAENAGTPELKNILLQIPPDELEDVVMQFLDIARNKMESLPVEIISAMPLTKEQLYRLQVKLIQVMRKQLEIVTTVDPTLLGGIRILVDNAVIDYSVKRRLLDIKQAIYEEVYQSDGRTPQ